MRISTGSRSRMQRLAKAAHPLNLSAHLSTRRHEQQTAVVLAVSPVDIRLAVEANPDHGELVSVYLPSAGGDELISVSGIVHWKEMRGSEYEVGIYLSQPLPTRLNHLCTDLRRQTERYRCRISGRLDWGSKRPDCEATIVNYSHDGMALQCPVAGEVDEVFTIRWVDGQITRSVQGVALWQIEQNGGYLIGCQLPAGGGLTVAGLQR